MTGVSPAFYISSFTNRFSLDEMAGSFSTVKSLGFESAQLEIFHHENLADWEKGGSGHVKNELASQNLASPVFVAHFLGDCVCDRERLMSDYGIDEWERVCGFLEEEALSSYICLPVFPYTDELRGEETEVFRDKINRMLGIARRKNLTMSVEVMPGSLGEDRAVFSSLTGVNMLFDPGHSHVMGWDIYSLPMDMAGRIAVTHLCENDGVTNNSLRPEALFDWPRIIRSLGEFAHVVSWDAEIVCAPENVAKEYGRAAQFLKELTADL